MFGTQTEFSPESLLSNCFILVKYDTHDTLCAGEIVCVCVCVCVNMKAIDVISERSCVCVCFHPSVRACVYYFFRLYL